MTSTADSTASPKPLLTIRPTSGWSALNLAEVWQFRDLMWSLAGRDIKLRYKQTAMGVVWVLLQPLVQAGIFTFIFGKVAAMPTDFVTTYAAMLAWNVFLSTLTKVSGSMVGNSHLVSKVYFPRLALPLSTMGSTLLDFAVAAALLVVLMIVKGVRPHAGLLTAPLWLTVMLVMALGLGLLMAALMVSYRDVGYVLPWVTQVMFYGSPIAISVAAVAV